MFFIVLPSAVPEGGCALGPQAFAIAAVIVHAMVASIHNPNPSIHYGPSAMNALRISPARSTELGEHSTTTAIIAGRLIPGQRGVILQQRAVAFSDLWRITALIGVEVSLTKDLHLGREIFRLRSGNRFESPITKPMYGLLRIIARTHPSGRSQRLPSMDDIKLLNQLFLHQLRTKADASLPHSRVIYGSGHRDFTIFWPSEMR